MIISEKQINNLKDVIKLQCSNGNYNCNEYMWGMANGLICALSVITGDKPNYLEKPERWLDDINSDNLGSASGVNS